MAQIFVVTDTTGKKGAPKKQLQVAGSKVIDGELDKSLKFRLVRDDTCIIENLTIHTMKKFKTDVNKVEKGTECGLAFNGLKGGIKLQEGDVIECYREREAAAEKFNFKPGFRTSY